MVDACEHATTSLSMHRRNTKTHAARDGPVIQLDCFASPRDRIAVGTPFAAAGARWLRLPRLNRTNTLWVKAAAFLAGMWDAFPRRRWYLKADEDTLLLPRSLARFFGACTAALPSQRPAYLGNVASTRPLGLLDAATAAGLRPRGEDAVRYANGGAGYVLNEAAMRIVAGVDDAQGAADATVGLLAAVRLYYGNYSLFAASRRQPQPAEGVAPLGEDAAVGLRLHVARVAPIHCECFYQGPPCADGVVSLNASECVVSERWLTASGALCEWPLSVHWLPTPAKLNAWVEAARQRGLLRPGGRIPSYMH